MSDRRFLFAHFQQQEILLEQGRIFFSLMNAFASNGYQIRLLDDLPAANLGKYGRMAYSLRGLTLANTIPNDMEHWIYLFDKEDKAIGNRSWHKKIQVRYNVFSSYRLKNAIIMPFPMHPVHATPDLMQRIEKYRSSQTSMRVFFSGDTKGYIRKPIQYPKPKLPRPVIIKTIIERMGENLLLAKDLSFFDNLYDSAYTNKCVIVDTNKIWVDDRIWLRVLAQADFFISPPGIGMPMCHNVIEAMAVGSIPITNYPEWFDPCLTHMENCIVFDDQEDLISQVKRALEMNRGQIERIRANVLNYFDTRIRPDAFIRRVESSKDKKITLLMLTEANAARNAEKLNRNSILIRGSVSSRENSFTQRLLQRLFPRP